MIDLLKIYGLPLLLSAIAGISGYFQGGAAAKENAVTRVDNKIGEVRTLAEKVKTDNELVNAVQNTTIEIIKKDITEIKMDVKEVLKTLKPEYYRPAVEEAPNAPLISGIDSKTGTPINANGKTKK